MRRLLHQKLIAATVGLLLTACLPLPCGARHTAMADVSPMPRPVDQYFKNWSGPTRPEFRKDIDMSRYTGNQKWLIWCLEQFLNYADSL